MQKWGEDIFKLTTGNENLRQDSNDNGVRVVTCTTSENLVVMGTVFPNSICKYTWTSPDGKTYNQIDHVLIDRRWHSSILMNDVSGELTVILNTIWWLQKLGKDC
jgi:hypothetical protein